MAKQFIQVGFTAMREPGTGNFLPAVPLYIEADEETTAAESEMIDDISKVFADHMRRYIEAGGPMPVTEK